MARKRNDPVVPGGVDEYIAACPAKARQQLSKMRAVIRKVAPEATETVSYFAMPGYSYEGYATTRAIVSFPLESDLPVAVITKLVAASLKAMKDKLQ